MKPSSSTLLNTRHKPTPANGLSNCAERCLPGKHVACALMLLPFAGHGDPNRRHCHSTHEPPTMPHASGWTWNAKVRRSAWAIVSSPVSCCNIRQLFSRAIAVTSRGYRGCASRPDCVTSRARSAEKTRRARHEGSRLTSESRLTLPSRPSRFSRKSRAPGLTLDPSRLTPDP